MAIQLIKNPYEITFSKNPILFSFRITPFSNADIDKRTRLAISIEIESEAFKGDFNKIWEGSEYPNGKGFVDIDIQSQIDAHLEYLVPDKNIIKFHHAKKQMKRYRISYYTIDNNNTISATTTSTLFFACKGGLSKQEFHESLFFTENVLANLQPLHFCYGENANDKNMIRMDEVKWIYFMLKTNIIEKLFFEVKLFFTDGTNTTYTVFEQPSNVKKWGILACRVDYEALQIESHTPIGKLVAQYQIIIKFWSAAISEFIDVAKRAKFTIDYRPFYNPIYLFYRNSLGGLDTQSFLGEMEFKIENEKTKAEKIPLNNLLGSFKIQDESFDYINFKVDTFSGNTGWLDLSIIDKLKDLFLNKQVFDLYGKKLRPIYINSNGTGLYKSTDSLYNLKLDWSVAFKDDSYTREHIVSQPDTCPAIYFIEFSQVKGGKLHVIWKLVDGYDKIHIELVYGSVTYDYYFYGNDGETDIFITTPNQLPVVNTSIDCRGRTICNDEVAPYSYGPYSTSVTVVVASAIAPITIEDVVDETYRGTGARILQLNAADYMPLYNDIANNGAGLNATEFFDSAGAPATTTENGAAISFVGGKVQYAPTTTSIAISNEDFFFYRCREMLPAFAGGIPGNKAKVRIPMKGQIPKVWIKLTGKELNETVYKYGLLNGYEDSSFSGDFYLTFYKDAACTIPIDVSTFGILLDYKISEDIITYNSIGNITSASYGNLSATTTITCTGFSMLILPAYFFWLFDKPSKTKKNRHFQLQNTSVGSFIFINNGF